MKLEINTTPCLKLIIFPLLGFEHETCWRKDQEHNDSFINKSHDDQQS